MPGAIYEWGVGAGLSPLEAATLRAIADKKGEWITAMQIAAVIYAHRVDGGPEWAGRCVAVLVCNLKRKMRQLPAPFAIESRSGAGYRLLQTERNAA